MKNLGRTIRRESRRRLLSPPPPPPLPSPAFPRFAGEDIPTFFLVLGAFSNLVVGEGAEVDGGTDNTTFNA